MSGAIAVVRVSGPGLATALASLVTLPAPRVAALRRLVWDGYQERALVLFFPGPGSTTGEDVVEFHLHGNPLLVRRFLEHLHAMGIRLAEPGEFTRRALLNGKMGLIEAEALRDLAQASTDAQIRQAQALGGHIPSWILEAQEAIRPWLAQAEAAVDYGEEEGIELDLAYMKARLALVREKFHVEQRRSRAARWLHDGICVALVGAPNAGKSTLFNALADEDRAIVTDIPGTTRDVLEVRTEWAGLPLVLFDMAGIRSSVDPVERLGVARVEPVLQRADVIIHLHPADVPHPDPHVMDMLRPFEDKVVHVRNKSDLMTSRPPDDAIRICALTGDLQALEAAIKLRFMDGLAPEACLGALATQRQRALLDDLVLQLDMLFDLHHGCPHELPASLLQGAWTLLARLTGEDRAETTLDALFSGFCLGK